MPLQRWAARTAITLKQVWGAEFDEFDGHLNST